MFEVNVLLYVIHIIGQIIRITLQPEDDLHLAETYSCVKKTYLCVTENFVRKIT
jgi:hypothetical protein